MVVANAFMDAHAFISFMLSRPLDCYVDLFSRPPYHSMKLSKLIKGASIKAKIFKQNSFVLMSRTCSNY